MREKLGLFLLFLVSLIVLGRIVDSCDYTPDNKAKENASLFPVRECSCWRKKLPFSNLINRDDANSGYEIFCRAILLNKTKEVVKNASVRVYLLTKNEFEIDSIKIRAKEDNYTPGSSITFTSDSPIENKSNFSKARCELLHYE